MLAAALPQAEDDVGEHGVNPAWLLVDRMVVERSGPAGAEVLVKWQQLEHEHCTWERVTDLREEDQAALATVRARRPITQVRGAQSRWLNSQ